MDKKKEKQSVVQLIRGFMQRANGDHVGAYAAQAAYFLIMSFIPFILFLTTMIRYTPLTYNMVSEAIRHLCPIIYRILCLPLYLRFMEEARQWCLFPLSWHCGLRGKPCSPLPMG